MQKILKALGTDFATFFSRESANDNQAVFLPEQMKSVEDAFRRYTLMLPRREDIKLEMVLEYLQQSEQESEWETNGCDLAGVVLEGGPLQLELQDAGVWEVHHHRR